MYVMILDVRIVDGRKYLGVNRQGLKTPLLPDPPLCILQGARNREIMR
jgi:hypothetical protein